MALFVALAAGCANVIDRPNECGDGVIDGRERCDDGNTFVRDGCGSECTVEPGWSCDGEPSVCQRDTVPFDTGVDAGPSDASPGPDTPDVNTDTPDVSTDTPVNTDTPIGTDTAPTPDADAGTTTDTGPGDATPADAGGDAAPDVPLDVSFDAPEPCADVDCTHLDSPCSVGTCDASGTCVRTVFPNGAGCDDGNLCTEGDRCSEGTCAGRAVLCGDGVCSTGTCDPATGLCALENADDGTACDSDPDDCTTEACQAGSCVATDTADDCTSCAGGDGVCMGGTCGVVSADVDTFDFEDGLPPGTQHPTTADWFIAAGEGRSGSAARAGAPGSSASSTMRVPFTLVEDGAVSAWIRVSSESGYDELIVRVNGAVRDTWSGEIGWSNISYALPAGAHTVTFTYSKDGSDASGQDTAWVDDLHFDGAAPCPGSACAEGVLAGSACGYCPLIAEGGSCDDDPADCVDAVCRSNACVTTTRPDCASCGADGSQRCAAGHCGGIAAPSTVFDMETPATTPDFATGPGGFWGDVYWGYTTDDAYSGSWSAASDYFGHGNEAWASFSHSMARAGTVSFWMRVTTERDYDFARFAVDGSRQGAWSGEIGWTRYTFPVAAGSHSYEWSYDKDGSSTGGGDRVYVDDIEFAEAPYCESSGCTASLWDGSSCISCDICE